MTESAQHVSSWDADFPVGSPLDFLLERINGGPHRKGNPKEPLYYHHVSRIDSCLWLEGSRERMFLLLVQRDVGAGKARQILQDAADIVAGALQSARTSGQPTPMKDLILRNTDPYLVHRLASIEVRVGENACNFF